MTNQASPIEEQEKLLDEALNVVKVQVNIYLVRFILCIIYKFVTRSCCYVSSTIYFSSYKIVNYSQNSL